MPRATGVMIMGEQGQERDGGIYQGVVFGAKRNRSITMHTYEASLLVEVEPGVVDRVFVHLVETEDKGVGLKQKRKTVALGLDEAMSLSNRLVQLVVHANEERDRLEAEALKIVLEEQREGNQDPICGGVVPRMTGSTGEVGN